jgi:hypothetical protein
MSGQELSDRAFERGPENVWVGRRGSLDGVELANDISSGEWRQRRFRVTRGGAAPDSGWFSLSDLLDKVDEYKMMAREAAGWRVEGVVVIDSASVAVAVAGAERRLESGGEIPAGPDMYVYITRADVNVPVETRTVDGVVVEVRVDVVDNVDEIIDGEWVPLGDLEVGDEGIVFFDPFVQLDGRMVNVQPGAGRWEVSLFSDAGDELSLRLSRLGQPGGG